MTLKAKRILLAVLGAAFLASLFFVQWMEILHKREELGLAPPTIAVSAESRECVQCHTEESPGIVNHWTGSTHAQKGVGCAECHKAEQGDVDGYDHHGVFIATVVTPRDCGGCHQDEHQEFTASHHSKAGDILHSLDNFLAETVEGSPVSFTPHSPTPGRSTRPVNGLASAFTGCHQCHGSKLALQSADGGAITVDDLRPAEDGKPTNHEAAERILKDDDGKPLYTAGSWPNTGIGRLNLDGSRGSCSACHSRHDFSPRRARQPENCGKCHLGPDHPQKEIYEESKHAIAYRDLKEQMNLDAESWILGEDYAAAPTCATCHMSGNVRNKGRITHDPGQRISWTNRPYISLVMDTDADGDVVKETDPHKRRALVVESADVKRTRMKNVCLHCHTPDYVNGFYKQYDDFLLLYNEKFGKPGEAIMAALKENGLTSPTSFDEEIEWTWFYLWHHEGRRARHGASMMAPDYAHWHGMYEVAERFYKELIPQARELIHHARSNGKATEADTVDRLIADILRRPEHAWFEQEAESHPAGMEAIGEPTTAEVIRQ